MASLIRFLFLLIIKSLARVFYRTEVVWVGEKSKDPFDGLRLGVVLNHTSLFEPIYSGVLPVSLIWRIAKQGVFPGADITIDRPIVGKIVKFLAPNVASITRKRDESWDAFLHLIREESLVILAPEGRMKRPTGLDKYGNPMTVLGGIVDVLQKLGHGKMLLVYSGGLHHVHAPGQGMPNLFKRLKVAFEVLEIERYGRELGAEVDAKLFRSNVIRDLEKRRDLHCPKLDL